MTVGDSRGRPGRACGRLGVVMVVAVVLIAASLVSAGGAAGAQSPETDPLLETLGRMAALYRDSALAFVARERIVWPTRRRNSMVQDARRSLELDYFYVAEETPNGTRLADYRTERDDEEGVPLNLWEQRLPAYLVRPYSWVFVFLPGQRELFELVVEGEGKAEGRDAQIISFRPRESLYRPGVDDAFGRIWVDRETRAPLRVEAVRLGAGTPGRPRRGFVLSGGGRGVLVELHLIDVEFGVEKNGLRFPSRGELTVGRVSFTDDRAQAIIRMVMGSSIDFTPSNQ